MTNVFMLSNVAALNSPHLTPHVRSHLPLSVK
jgi:hypothetical protein